MEAAVKKRWSVTVSDLQAWTYILDCTLCARNTYYSLFGGDAYIVSVWNGRLTELTVSIHYLHHVLD